MERVDAKATARCVMLIECSPQDLRMVITRLEMAEKNCLPGHEILVPFSNTVMLCYRPPIKSPAATDLLASSTTDSDDFPETQVSNPQ